MSRSSRCYLHTPSRATLGPHLTWMDTAMHDMGSLGHMLQIDFPCSMRLSEPRLGTCAGFAFAVEGQGFEFCVLVVGWRPAFRSTPGGGLPVRIWPGIIQVSRSRVNE